MIKVPKPGRLSGETAGPPLSCHSTSNALPLRCSTMRQVTAVLPCSPKVPYLAEFVAKFVHDHRKGCGEVRRKQQFRSLNTDTPFGVSGIRRQQTMDKSTNIGAFPFGLHQKIVSMRKCDQAVFILLERFRACIAAQRLARHRQDDSQCVLHAVGQFLKQKNLLRLPGLCFRDVLNGSHKPRCLPRIGGFCEKRLSHSSQPPVLALALQSKLDGKTALPGCLQG